MTGQCKTYFNVSVVTLRQPQVLSGRDAQEKRVELPNQGSIRVGVEVYRQCDTKNSSTALMLIVGRILVSGEIGCNLSCGALLAVNDPGFFVGSHVSVAMPRIRQMQCNLLTCRNGSVPDSRIYVQPIIRNITTCVN